MRKGKRAGDSVPKTSELVESSKNCQCSKCGHRHHLKTGQVLSNVELLEVFCRAAEYHMELEKHFPIPAHDIYSLVPGQTNQHKDAWNRLVLAASFRKFVVDSNEPVYLPKVLQVLVELGAQSATKQQILEFRRQLNAIKKGHPIIGKFDVGDGRSWTAWQVVDALLNGMFLHADLRNSAKAGEWNAWMKDQSLFEWLGAFRSDFLSLYVSASHMLEELHGNKPEPRAATGHRAPWELPHGDN